MESTIQALLFDAMMNKKISQLVKGISVDELNAILSRMSEDGNFAIGKYSFYCSKCGGSWRFENKHDCAFFERLHKIAGCALETVVSEDAIVTKRCPGFINNKSVKFLNEYLANEILKESTNAQPEAVMLKESAAE